MDFDDSVEIQIPFNDDADWILTSRSGAGRG